MFEDASEKDTNSQNSVSLYGETESDQTFSEVSFGEAF